MSAIYPDQQPKLTIGRIVLYTRLNEEPYAPTVHAALVIEVEPKTGVPRLRVFVPRGGDFEVHAPFTTAEPGTEAAACFWCWPPRVA